jgi:hypothetical protein
VIARSGTRRRQPLDRPFLPPDLQYRADANLAARQSLYDSQQPRIDLPPLLRRDPVACVPLDDLGAVAVLLKSSFPLYGDYQRLYQDHR